MQTTLLKTNNTTKPELSVYQDPLQQTKGCYLSITAFRV